MLSMLLFCRAIKCRSLWHLNAVRRVEAEGMSRSLEHVLFSVGGKLASPIIAEVKKVD